MASVTQQASGPLTGEADGPSSSPRHFIKKKLPAFAPEIKQLLVDREQTTLQIWDTAGQERYQSITQCYFHKAHGVLLLYNISSPSSFLSFCQWIEDIKATERPLPLMLVGNKTDLRRSLPEAAGVRTAHRQQLAMAHGSLFCETSAKDSTNVVEVVLHLAQ
ncbi:ras and EF-hand domain-containing protein-like [Harpia harpyja]|uniref:ras and EF-hand domain-containing protein-like n=1 Tax=Harpia harpyja TaxID=202280 RepID=UPI0022B18298|nr:ras and EF-hand domain-containing protein-like [Harpia harpyja]